MDTIIYNNKIPTDDKAICYLLFQEINKHLPKVDNKISHKSRLVRDGKPNVG